MESELRVPGKHSKSTRNGSYQSIKYLYQFEWKKAVKHHVPFKGNVEILIENFNQQDIDSPIKLILDSLVGTVIVDDKQITKLTALLFSEKKEYMRITVSLVGSVRDIMRNRIRNGEWFLS